MDQVPKERNNNMIPESPGSVELVADVDQAISWLEQLHGDSTGYIHLCSAGNWAGAVCHNNAQTASYIRMMDHRQAQGIYARATTVNVPYFERGTRGGVEHTDSVPALWADVDFAGPGHKSDKPLPPGEDEARRLVMESGLPEPTIWVHSGGGLYPYWLLTEPIRYQDHPEVAELSRRWHEILAKSAERLGWHYGTETSDLARVLRLPGTINRKVPSSPRMVTITEGGTGRMFSYEGLRECARQAVEPRVIADGVTWQGQSPEPSQALISAPLPPIPQPSQIVEQDSGLSPGDAFEQQASWEEILVPHGWTLFKDHGHNYKEWTRPNKPTREGSSATTGRDRDRDRLYVFSSSTPFEPNAAYNKFAAYAVLNHGGDHSAAAAELRHMGYGGSFPERAGPPDEFRPGTELEQKTATPPAKRPIRSGFVDRSGLLAQSLWEAVKEQGLFTVDQGRHIYSYQDGVWRRDGEWKVRSLVQELLGEEYRMSHASTVVDMFRNQDPLFTDDSVDTKFLNLPNGLLDWRTGELHPHTPDVPSMNRIPIKWNPEARCPKIEEWVQQVVPADCVETIYEVAGYCLFNGNPFHKAIMLYAQGRNGKGTFIRLLKDLVGRENTTAQSPQLLDTNRFRAAELHGKLANLVGDVDPRTFTATEMFKQLTGEDMVSVERKNKNPFNMVCRSLMVCSFNELPTSADATTGFFSRWIVIPFIGYFPPGIANMGVEQALHTPGELEGLLVRAVAGLQQLMGRPDFAVSENTNQATEKFRLAADPVRAFLSEQKEYISDDGFTPRNKVYQVYERWAADNGHKRPLSAVKFYQRVENCALEVLGVPLIVRKHQGTFGFKGIQLPDHISVPFGLNQYVN